MSVIFRLFAYCGLLLTNASLAVPPVPDSPSRKIDITQTGDMLGLPPVVATDEFDREIAAENSRRIQAIMQHPRVGPHCLIYFPAGSYHFDGAADGWQGTIETTAPHQSIQGDGMNHTRIFQHSRTVACTVRLQHDSATLERLFIGSGDASTEYQPQWEPIEERHQVAVELAAPVSDGRVWRTDPRILQVAVNSYGNTILQQRFSRPFEIAVRIVGSWLNVYIDEMWINDTAVGVYVNQESVMAGPAKIMRINQYSTHSPRRDSKVWTTFFKSETHFMEQVELIHNTFIGAQFIYMDGRPSRGGEGTSPAYDMVIDHNYVNVFDVGDAPEAKLDGPTNSGIYMNLPPKLSGTPNYSRDIRFTNNSCTGRAPRRGAFFYVEGMCRGITFSGNDISSPAVDKAIYIRPTERLERDGVSPAGEVAIRDIKITDNYFRSFSNLVTIGGDLNDPERTRRPQGDPHRGEDDDPWLVQRVIIAHNQNMMEGSSASFGLSGIYLNRVRQAVVQANTLVETAGTAVAIRDCHDVAISSNSFRGLAKPRGRQGIHVSRSKSVAISGNVLADFQLGLVVQDSRRVTLGQNVLGAVGRGVVATGNKSVVVSGNVVESQGIGIDDAGNQQMILSGNLGIADRTDIKD
jgi:hypothetical protein